LAKPILGFRPWHMPEYLSMRYAIYMRDREIWSSKYIGIRIELCIELTDISLQKRDF